jgi:hypothetical protein
VVHRISTIESPKLSRSWNTYCFLLFAAMWNGMLVWMVWMVLRDAQSWRRLASHGTAVLGRITDKQMVHSRGWKYILTYRFPGDGAEQEATMWVRRRDFEAIQVGQPVTVVFDPADPKNSLIYRCGEYAVVGLD